VFALWERNLLREYVVKLSRNTHGVQEPLRGKLRSHNISTQVFYTEMKHSLLRYCLLLLLLPALAFAAEDLLLNEDVLASYIAKQPEYQLLDARNPEAQRISPLAFSTKYQKSMTFKKGLVLIVADNDAAALAIARAIPAVSDCSVFAIKGGAAAWKRVSSKAPPPSTMSDSFVIPMNTCEQGKPLQTLKRNKTKTQAPAK
jgi:hypothetical protein